MPQTNSRWFLDNITGCLGESLLRKFGFLFQFRKFLKFRLIEKHKSIVMENDRTTLLISSLWSCSCSKCEPQAQKPMGCNGSQGMAARSLCSFLIKLMNP